MQPLLLTLSFLAFACADASTGSPTATPCQMLLACCSTLAVQATSCAQAASSAMAEDECAAALQAYESADGCRGADAGSIDAFVLADAGSQAHRPPQVDAAPSFADAGATVSQAPVCARYLTCIAAVEPAELPGSLTAYGPSGACWDGAASAASACVTACTTGLAALRAANPSATECPLCVSDSDCDGMPGASACTVSGLCVECTSDAQCGLEHCNVATNTCVACLDDSQCTTTGLSHCDTVTSTCVECIDGSECSSGRCEADDSCCVPTGCGETTCGTVEDGCGKQISCGTCAAPMYCGDMGCTSLGVPCAVGTPGECGGAEVCAYDDWHQDYRCSPSLENEPCEGYPDPTCGGYEYTDGSPVDDFTCVGPGSAVCGRNCLTSADCASGQTCVEWEDNPITMSLPGTCSPPLSPP